MKRLTTLLLAFLFVFAGFGQEVLTYDGKVLTYDNKVLYAQVPPDQVSGLEFWLDGKNPSSFTLSNDTIDQWNDISGNDRHVLNSNNDATRPTYSSATGRVIFKNANSTYLQSAPFGPLVQPTTIFILYKITGALSDNEVVFDGITSYRQNIRFFGGNFEIHASVALTNGASDANDNIHCAEFNGVPSNYWINGILVAGPGNTGGNALNGITLGARGDLDANADVEIREVFGYSRVLSEGERIILTNYLQDKWDLSLWFIILLIPNIRRKLEIAA